MGDRLDIDALLIGALYGELDGDDRARLDAHLTSHPADRAALDTLRSTRALLVDHGAREFLGAAEPANAISARLIQEAARRAPTPRAAAGGVLGFLAGLFRPIAAHPAMSAAAAMLIVVGAGSLMMRRGTLEVVQPNAPAISAPAVPTTTPDLVAAPPVVAQPGSGDGYAVSLDEPAAAGEKLRSQVDRDNRDANLEGKLAKKDALAASKPGARATKPTAVVQPKPEEQNGFLEVDKAQRGAEIALKTEDDGDGADDDFKTADERVATGAAAPAPAKNASVAGAGGASRPPSDAPATVPQRSPDTALITWARDQHARMVKLVNQGRCTEAGQIGAEIARKAPDYYQSAVANDRAVRSCQAYVDQARRAKQPAKPKNVAEPDQMEDSVKSK